VISQRDPVPQEANFAAACAAAGVEEEHHDLPEGTALDGLIAALLAVDRRIERSSGNFFGHDHRPERHPAERGRAARSRRET
jgi:hypothetical protein